MLMQRLALAFAIPLSLLVSVGGQAVQTGDFAWAVEPVDGYPTVAFSDAASGSGELEFLYVYEGTQSETKYLTYNLLQYDCLNASDGTIEIVNVDQSIPGQLGFFADVDQATISDSLVHYRDLNSTFSEISFCTRVDYNYINLLGEEESINFHETKIAISIDRTAGFEIAAIDVIRVNATEADTNAELDYPVTAFFCDDLNVQKGPTPFAQGSAMQVCVKMDDSVTAEVYVQDILSFAISQPLGPADPSIAILNTQTDALTAKSCGADGMCNVKSQLGSKFFVDQIPNALRVDGTALLAFGSPSGQQRMLRAKISGSINRAPEQRRLQGTQSPFDLEVLLYQEEILTEEGATEATLMVGLVVSLVLSAILCIVMNVCCRRKKEIVKINYDMNFKHQGPPPAGPYGGPTPAGPYSGPPPPNYLDSRTVATSSSESYSRGSSPPHYAPPRHPSSHALRDDYGYDEDYRQPDSRSLRYDGPPQQSNYWDPYREDEYDDEPRQAPRKSMGAASIYSDSQSRYREERGRGSEFDDDRARQQRQHSEYDEDRPIAYPPQLRPSKSGNSLNRLGDNDDEYSMDHRPQRRSSMGGRSLNRGGEYDDAPQHGRTPSRRDLMSKQSSGRSLAQSHQEFSSKARTRNFRELDKSSSHRNIYEQDRERIMDYLSNSQGSINSNWADEPY